MGLNFSIEIQILTNILNFFVCICPIIGVYKRISKRKLCVRCLSDRLLLD